MNSEPEKVVLDFGKAQPVTLDFSKAESVVVESIVEDVAQDIVAEVAEDVPQQPKPPRISPGFKTFEELIPHLPGLENLDLDHPSGFEYGNSTHDKRQALCCRLGLTPPLCRRQMIGSLERGCADNETIKRAIVAWANRVIDLPFDISKPQARLVGVWRLKYTEHNARYSEFSKWLQDDDDKYYENEMVSVASERIPPRVDVAPDPIGPAEFRPDLSIPPSPVTRSHF